MDANQSLGMDTKKNTIESMSREELINKCKGLLGLAKQAKKSKDESAEENLKLKEQIKDFETQREADKNSLLTMKEFTKRKLELATELSELREKNKLLMDEQIKNTREKETFAIENEALQRQVNRLTEDNESLLIDINQMDERLNQVNILGKEQKQHLHILELEVEKLKEHETSNKKLSAEFQALEKKHDVLNKSYNLLQNESQAMAIKYQNLKEINSEQRNKFQGLKDRFIEVHKKLKQLKECKRVLVESHHEYADSITRWQMEIMQASEQLCNHIQCLKEENSSLKNKIQTKGEDFGIVLPQLPILLECCEKALLEYRQQDVLINELRDKNNNLKTKLNLKPQSCSDKVHEECREKYIDLKQKTENDIKSLAAEKLQLQEKLSRAEENVCENKIQINSLKTEIINLTKQLSTITSLKEKLKNDAFTIRQSEGNQAANRTVHANETIKNLSDASDCRIKINTDIISSYLPSLLDCCEKALLEQKQQTELIDNLKHRIEKEHNKDLVIKLKNENERLKKELNALKKYDVDIEDVIKIKNDLIANNQTCEDLQTKLEKQERENIDLLNEMRELNEALKGRGDVISKQQAKNQEMLTEMKKTSSALSKIELDLQSKEEVIREKETKIKKLSEDNKSALQEVNRLQNSLRENESKIKQLTDEITIIRAQLDHTDAQSEVLSTSTISRAEEQARIREVDESFEEKYNKLRSLAVKMKAKSHEQKIYIVELEKQVEESKTKITDITEKIYSVENERDSLHNELNNCKNQIDSLRTAVDKLKISKKQSNVLNLEIEAFEKSLNETSAKLTAKTAEYDRMCEAIQIKELAIETLKKENKILEESKDSEICHSAELKRQLDKLQTQLKDVVHIKQETAAKFDECITEKQSLQLEVDELKKNILLLSQKCNDEQLVLTKENEHLVHRVNSLEVELIDSKNKIALAERSFQGLKAEFANYKIKAQSVLRQNQTKESSKERELEEELKLVKNDHKNLSERFQIFLGKYEASEKVIEELQENNRCLQNRNSELQVSIAEIRQQSIVLSKENKKQLETYQETLKGHRLQIEALESCHLQQIQDLHSKYNREIIDLKKNQSKVSDSFTLKPHVKNDYTLIEREDAEGSEVEATHVPKFMQSTKRSSLDLIPLEELLSTPFNSNCTTIESGTTLSPSIELQETKERLMKQESRVKHLTSLLAESEQDLARLTQLNEMLKEEVRRQERTVEREKHMHNSEYLKNVVLKFVSLNNGDERTRLVPVLNTILKLSPSEIEMLQNIAKGKALDNNNRSWGNLLSSWNTS